MEKIQRVVLKKSMDKAKVRGYLRSKIRLLQILIQANDKWYPTVIKIDKSTRGYDFNDIIACYDALDQNEMVTHIKTRKTVSVPLKKAFSILDGRVSTNISDVKEMLDYIFDADFHIFELPEAIMRLRTVNPDWYQEGLRRLHSIEFIHGTRNFYELMSLIESKYNINIEIGKI